MIYIHINIFDVAFKKKFGSSKVNVIRFQFAFGNERHSSCRDHNQQEGPDIKYINFDLYQL